MKINRIRKMSMLLALLFMVPLLWNMSSTVASAATPAFTQTKIEIVGKDETYQLDIKNKKTNSTYKWSSSNTAVAKVSSKGLVTAVAKGSADVKCKITYSTGTTKTLTCKVTVLIPATKVAISNAKEVNGAHTMKVGETYDFNRKITPSTSSDKTYWSIGKGDKDSIRIDNSSTGLVTALKPGTVVLIATAAKKATAAEAAKSNVYDSVIIEVVAPKAEVSSAEIISSNELKVVFDSPIDKNTVIVAPNKLSDNIVINVGKDVKGVWGKDPGNLTASLSPDSKTLTITSEKTFEGNYSISFSKNIKTIDGIAIEEYFKQLTYIDTEGPKVLSSVLDDSGYINTITFDEAVDFSKLKISNATVIGGSAADPSTIITLNNKLNYIINEDKKSMKINMSNIISSDRNKIFTIAITGITDLSGNYPENGFLATTVRTDSTPKPQAIPITRIRTAYNTITVTFNRAISKPGYAQINSGSLITGIIDQNDNKKVHYTISEAEALLTGIQTFAIGFWDSYNVSPSDRLADTMQKYSVDFTVDKTGPSLVSYEFDQESKILTLTYNKDAGLTVSSGFSTYKIRTLADEITNGTITYTRLPSTDPKIVKVLIGNMSMLGNYTITLSQGFVMDNFKNLSVSREITISNITESNRELPAPYLITQSTTDLNKIHIQFAQQLDEASAINVTNYTIQGVKIISASLEKNTALNGAEVVLTVADESITVTAERPITISGVKGHNGSYSEIQYTKPVLLTENTKPTLTTTVYDKASLNVIRLNFNKEIKGTITFNITQIGTTPFTIPNSAVVSGNSIIITLSGVPTNNAYLKIDVLTSNITDTNGNEMKPFITTGVVAAQY